MLLNLTLRDIYIFFFFNDTATTEIYTLSLHDALPIYMQQLAVDGVALVPGVQRGAVAARPTYRFHRSEEHTSELQSRSDLVCRLLLEKKKKHTRHRPRSTSCMHASRPLRSLYQCHPAY